MGGVRRTVNDAEAGALSKRSERSHVPWRRVNLDLDGVDFKVEVEHALCAASVVDERDENDGEVRAVAPKQPNHDQSDGELCNKAQD